MIRLLFTFLFVLSLLLCAGTCVLWARSYWRMDGVMFSTRFGCNTVNEYAGNDPVKDAPMAENGSAG